MKVVGTLYFDWISANIHNILVGNPDIIARHPMVLITSIDSTRPLETTTAQLICSDPTLHAKMHGYGIALPGSEVPRLIDSYNLFTGFDELWCFTNEPKVVKPEGLSIVLPRKISDDFPADLDSWMNESGCILGLGDGEGLNYVTTDPDIATTIEELVL